MYLNDLFTAKVEGALTGSLENAAFMFHYDPTFLEFQSRKLPGLFQFEFANLPSGTTGPIACGFTGATLADRTIEFLAVNFKAIKTGSTRLYLDMVEMKLSNLEIDKVVNDKTFNIEALPAINRIVIDINIYELPPTTGVRAFLKKLL